VWCLGWGRERREHLLIRIAVLTEYSWEQRGKEATKLYLFQQESSWGAAIVYRWPGGPVGQSLTVIICMRHHIVPGKLFFLPEAVS
jgi:hypothetical protein